MSDANEEGSSNSIDESVIHEAESQGWVPKERYRGDEKDWIDADMFVKRGREIMPILRKNNENLLKDLNNTKMQLAEFRETAEEFKKYQKEGYERKVKELEIQIANAKTARAQAITDGDGQKVNAIDDFIDKTKDEKAEAQKSATVEARTTIDPPSSIDPNLQSWLDKNEWFGKDKRLTKQANALGEDLREEFPELQGPAFLKKLDETLREEFPDKFPGTKRAAGGAVESGSGRGRSVSADKHSYDNLPADAKAACDKFVKQKLMTKEQYVADFQWD